MSARLAEPGTAVRLSPRQLEVIRLVADGYTDQEIGKQLFMGLRTVRTRIEEVRFALDGRNRTHAVARAYQLGLLGGAS